MNIDVIKEKTIENGQIRKTRNDSAISCCFEETRIDNDVILIK
jgi:hypothetical protein